MKFTATEHISQPIDRVWERLADLEGFEARVRPHVDSIERRPPGPPGRGTRWEARAKVMGKERLVDVAITDIRAPNRLAARAEIEGVEVAVDIVLTVSSPSMTTMTVNTEATAKGIAGKLLLAAAGAAKDRLSGRYVKQVSGLAKRIGKDPTVS